MKRLLALFIFNILMVGGAYAQAQADVQTLINTQVPITWQAGLSGEAMQNILTNILGTAFTPNGTVTITPPPGTTNQGINITQVPPAAGSINTFPGQNWNNITLSGDDMNANASFNRSIVLNLQQTSGGSNEGGIKAGLWITMDHNVASPANVNKGSHYGMWVLSRSEATDGGTDTGSGSAGQYVGASIEGFTQNTATNINLVEGIEVHVAMQGTSSAQYRWAFSAQDQSIGSNPQGAGGDAAYQIVSGGGTGFKNGMYLFSIQPISTTGCVICTDGTSTTITTGIDLSAYTISGSFLKGPGSLFTVSGAGALKAASFAAGANAGVSCAANTVTLATLVVSSGIVTHC
jgi:hypothetical protein